MSYGQRPEALDTRWIFRCYAVAAAAGGFLLMAWGPMWLGAGFGGEPWAKAALIRVFGAIFAAAACWAASLVRVQSAPDRRFGLICFTAAHGLIALVLLSQQIAIWGPGLGEKAAALLGLTTVLLLYLILTAEGEALPRPLTTLFGVEPRRSAEELRSQYEQQIREAARQEERNRLARDLHDSIKQQIFVVQTAAATAQTRFESDPGGAREALEQVRAAGREAMTEMQAMLDQLRAVPLENAGLTEALKKQCDALGFRTGATVEFKLGNLPDSRQLPPGAHEALLRVAQEALANVGRHARAGKVLVSLTSVQGRLELRIEDDGAGFDPAQDPRGQGIANMRARAQELGAIFEVNSRPGAGTSILFSLPYTVAESPQVYRRKALMFAVGFAILTPFCIWRRDPLMALWAFTCGVWALRFRAAYLRVRGAAR
jgi:signal transduction histidine kinase